MYKKILVPLDGSRPPVASRRNVVLPAPLGPTMPVQPREKWASTSDPTMRQTAWSDVVDLFNRKYWEQNASSIPGYTPTTCPIKPPPH